MTRFLFWNLHRADATAEPKRAAAICASLTRLVRDRSLDVLVFAENELADAEVKAALDASGDPSFQRVETSGARIVIWTRTGRVVGLDRYSGAVNDRIAVCELAIGKLPPVWLIGAHLRDRAKLTTAEGRGVAAARVAEAIGRFEARKKSSRTLLVGDLNMNPYEAGVLGQGGFHAMMTRDLAGSVPHLKARRGKPSFYNPMWGLFGDATPGPPGTYFWENAEEATNHFWQMYDQLLIRPELLDQFERIEILTGDGVEFFLTAAGRPRTDSFSDHLPLYFGFDFTR